jgi:hypothetical protein
LYSSPSIIILIKPRRMRARTTNGGEKGAYKILVGKPNERRALGRPRRMWLDNIKMDLREIRWDGIYCIDVAQIRNQ